MFELDHPQHRVRAPAPSGPDPGRPSPPPAPPGRSATAGRSDRSASRRPARRPPIAQQRLHQYRSGFRLIDALTTTIETGVVEAVVRAGRHRPGTSGRRSVKSTTFTEPGGPLGDVARHRHHAVDAPVRKHRRRRTSAASLGLLRRPEEGTDPRPFGAQPWSFSLGVALPQHDMRRLRRGNVRRAFITQGQQIDAAQLLSRAQQHRRDRQVQTWSTSRSCGYWRMVETPPPSRTSRPPAALVARFIPIERDGERVDFELCHIPRVATRELTSTTRPAHSGDVHLPYSRPRIREIDIIKGGGGGDRLPAAIRNFAGGPGDCQSDGRGLQESNLQPTD